LRGNGNNFPLKGAGAPPFTEVPVPGMKAKVKYHIPLRGMRAEVNYHRGRGDFIYIFLAKIRKIIQS